MTLQKPEISTFERTSSAGYMTNWAARLFAQTINRHLTPIGLSVAHLPVLFALAEGPPLSQRALAEIASVEQPTMAALLARMQRDGLIERHRDPNDGRGSLLNLSPAAKEKLPAVRKAIQEVNATALCDLNEQEKEFYFSALGKIIDTLKSAK